MSTATEIKAKLENKIDHMKLHVGAINEKLHLMQTEYKYQMAAEELKVKFEENDHIGYYMWTYLRTFRSHKCFASEELILFGTKAYRGTRKVKSNTEFYATLYPEEIWLTNEEFTMRRLKGQL